VAPPSGPAGIEITISGQDFQPYAEYVFYWVPPDAQIGEARLADDIGQIAPFTYTVPASAAVGEYEIVVRLDSTVSAQAPFQVTE
jgi:hypothetical protein